MKILTFSTLYPNAVNPHHGIFTETALNKVMETGKVQTVVIAPVPWFPFKHASFGRYGRFARVPLTETRSGVRVLHPRYLLPPKVGMHIAPFLMALAALKTIRQLIDDGFDFDVIDAHYFYPDGVAAILLGRYFKKPVVITALGTDINLIPKFYLPKKMILWAGRNASAVVTVCEALKTELAHIGMRRNDITPLRNGVDLSLFQPVDRPVTRARLGIHGFTLLSVGHLIDRKGHHRVIAALAQMPEVSLVIVGAGPDGPKLKKLAIERQVHHRVSFVGALPQEALRHYYGACDALVLASSREGWANVLLESLACGTPVVASNVWGTPEVIRSAEAGVLLASNTPEGIVQAVTTLRAHYPNRGATRAYAERFSWTDTTREKVVLYARVMSTAR
jgi:teichuronic acid biosynthesis glycosyltransferase TuaC